MAGLEEKEERKLQFCMCFSSEEFGDPLSWYSFNPEEEDPESNQLPDFFQESGFSQSGFPLFLDEGFSCAVVGSKLYIVGGSIGSGDMNSRMVFCYHLLHKFWFRTRDMKLPRYNPQLLVSPSPLASMRENSSLYLYAVGSGLSHTDPIETLEPLVEVYDYNENKWHTPTKGLPPSIDTRGIYDTAIVEIDSYKKLFITLANHSVTLDLQTDEWEDVTDRFWELRKFFSESSPVFYKNVWYVYDYDLKAVRGFDFSRQLWFNLEGLGKIDSYSSHLFNIGENMYLVCSTPNSDHVTSSIYSVKFNITEDVDGFRGAHNVFKSRSRIVVGTKLLHCLPIPDSVCSEMEILTDSAARAGPEDFGAPGHPKFLALDSKKKKSLPLF